MRLPAAPEDDTPEMAAARARRVAARMALRAQARMVEGADQGARVAPAGGPNAAPFANPVRRLPTVPRDGQAAEAAGAVPRQPPAGAQERAGRESAGVPAAVPQGGRAAQANAVVLVPADQQSLVPAVARGAARPVRATDPERYVVASTVQAAQMRPRHYGVMALFFLCVIVPTLSLSWYLWSRADDQYESIVGFGSRTEEAPSTFDFLGALSGGSQSGSKDMDILNQFIVSQELVAKVDADLDLRAMWSKPDDDPLNAFNPDCTIEDLVDYWHRMVLVNYDTGTGLMSLSVFAFAPQDAQDIAKAVLAESTSIINELSKTAQEDTTRYSKEALAATEQKLTAARLAVLDFQVRNNIVDPSNIIANQLSVIGTLNQQLAEAQIDYDMLAGRVPATDNRLEQLGVRLGVIRNRIAEEQAKVGTSDGGGSQGFAKLMGDFEELKVAQDFAQQAYLSALAAHDQALSDAQQKTRYLAAYVNPTLAEAATAPNRPLTAALTALIGFLLWSVLVLSYYALRDRR